MAQRRIGARSFRPRARPNVEWSDLSDVLTVVASGKVLLAGLTSTIELQQTILRVRTMLGVGSDQVIASEQQIGAFGMIIVTDDAFAAGASAIPGPVSDPSADWFVYQPFIQSFQFDTAAGFDHAAFHQYDVDSKAKRVLEATETVAIMIELASDSEGITTGH